MGIHGRDSEICEAHIATLKSIHVRIKESKYEKGTRINNYVKLYALKLFIFLFVEKGVSKI